MVSSHIPVSKLLQFDSSKKEKTFLQRELSPGTVQLQHSSADMLLSSHNQDESFLSK